MTSRTDGSSAAVAAGLAIGVCCGLPVLASIGFAGLVAGIGLGSWLLIGAAAAIAVFGVWRGRRSACVPPSTDRETSIRRSSPTDQQMQDRPVAGRATPRHGEGSR